MKFISWSVIGLSALCLAGCGKKDTKATSPGSTAANVSKPGESAAVPGTTQLSKETVGQTIAYTNNVIDFLNAGGEAMNRLERTTSSLAENIKEADDRKENFAWVRPTTIVDIGAPFSSTITGQLAKFPANIGAADRAVFTDNTKIMIGAIESIRAALKTCDTYLNNQDYKDDQGAKAKAMLTEISQKAEAYSAAREILGAKIHEISDQAEIIALKGHPLRDHIIAMKADMNAARDFMQLMTSKDMATNDPGSRDPVKGNFTPIAADAKAAYAKLEVLQKEHAAINPAALEQAGETAHYKEFYAKMEAFIGSARKNIRFGEEKSYLLEDFVQEMDRERQNMISAYNAFAG